MAKRNSEFGAGHDGAKGEDIGIIKPAVERAAISGGESNARNQPTPIKPKVVDPDRPSVFEDNTTIDEKELATSRRRYVTSGGKVSDEPNVSRTITTPTDRNATSKEALARLNEHYSILNAFATTHHGAIRTAAKSIPLAFKGHAKATKSLSEASTNLALAREAFAGRKNSAKGNGHLQSAVRSLISAHKDLNSKNVREVTGTPVSIHPDELASWQKHVNKLPAFRRQGKPFDRVQIAEVAVPPTSGDVLELEESTKGSIVADKIRTARTGTPRTPKWERDLPSMPTREEKGTGVIDTRTRGTSSGTTGANDPRRKASKTTRIEQRLRRPNLPKIGDTVKKAKPAMKPGDTVEGK
jgi:hypothetical protein